LRARIEAGGGSRAVRVVWGDDGDERVEAALTELVSPSLFGGAPLVVLRRAEALDGSQEEHVLALLPRLFDGVHLVLVAKGLDQRRRLHAACASNGSAIAFGHPGDPQAVAGWVTTLARERGHTIAPAAVALLLERVGFELARLDDELEKLSLHVGAGKAIDVATVDGLVATSRAHAIEELTDRLARRDLAGALRAVHGLVAAGEPPIRMVAFLAANLRRALHVSELAAAGLREDAIAARLGMPGWLVARQTRRGTPAELEAALAALGELDLALKSSRPEEAMLDWTVLGIAGGRGRADATVRT
jgi:DNA polymerase-3 subunit delta